jgi:NDP-sugar pyrophosphorylase family protein
MNERQRALLQRLADGGRGVSHPPQEVVDDLYALEREGYVRDVETMEDHQHADRRWYLAMAIVTEEGREALRKGL